MYIGIRCKDFAISKVNTNLNEEDEMMLKSYHLVFSYRKIRQKVEEGTRHK